MKTEDDSKTSSKLKLHFFYVALILSLGIIGLITKDWTQIEDFRDFLSVGATLTSLVLGVLAIIYSFVSTGQQSSALGTIEAAASSAAEAVGKLDTFMARAEALQKDAAERTTLMHQLTKSLTTSVDEIKGETTALATVSREMAGKVDLLPEQLGELKGMIQKGTTPGPVPSPVGQGSADPQWTDDAIKAALSVTSGYGLCIIDCLAKAAQSQKDVSTKILAKACGANDPSYFWGLLIGFLSTLMVRAAYRQEENSQFQVQWVHARLTHHVDEEWARREKSATTAEQKAGVAFFRAAVWVGLVDPPTLTPSPSPSPTPTPVP